jgi:L-histidine Nalpha-methyltransferase
MDDLRGTGAVRSPRRAQHSTTLDPRLPTWRSAIPSTLADPPDADVAPPADATLEFARAVAAGLAASPKRLPSRFLYDAQGSALFEEITRQPEYYLTRAEASILDRRAEEIRELTGPATVIELGSGSARKTGRLLAAYAARDRSVRYVPVDVSETALRLAARTLGRACPGVEVTGIVGDYQEAFRRFREHSPCLVLFLGSTVGNLDEDEWAVFWTGIAAGLPPGDCFLLGVDLVKDVATLEAAYNDRAGVSARFTKNVFARINRELGAELDLDLLEHVARYDRDRQRIEICARFLADQEVRLAPLDLTLRVAAGEAVRTEISRKFVLDEVRRELAGFGLRTLRAYTDESERFGLLLLRREEDP